jgi:hypothetical protein
MVCPISYTEPIFVALFYNSSLFISNLTHFQYQRQELSTSFTYLIIENSDIITGYLNDVGYANNLYYFTLTAYDAALNPVIVSLDQLQL